MNRLMADSLSRRFLRLFESKLFSGVVIGGAMTVLVKAIAFSKELVVANRFGTSDDLDAFLVAALIPTLIANMGGDSFRDAVVPAYTALRAKIGDGATRLYSNIIWICAGALVLSCLAVLASDDALVQLFGAGFSEEKRDLTKSLQVWLLPFAVFYGVATLVKGFIQTDFRFGFSSVAPAIVPVTTITVLLLVTGSPEPYLLSLGMSVGSLLLLIALSVAAARGTGGRLINRPGWDASTRSALSHIFPLLVGSAVYEGCYFIDKMMAASLSPGSVSVLGYAVRISTIVLSIGGIAAGQVLFPHVAGLAAAERWGELRRVVTRFSGVVLIASLPCAAFFWVAAEPVVRLLLQHGRFTAEDTARVAEVLKFTSFYIPGFILTLLGGRIVMALRSSRFMLGVTVFGFVNNVVLNLIFMNAFGVKGLALSTAVVSLVSAILLYGFFFRRISRLERAPGTGGP